MATRAGALDKDRENSSGGTPVTSRGGTNTARTTGAY
jgi:hypothetical protein